MAPKRKAMNNDQEYNPKDTLATNEVSTMIRRSKRTQKGENTELQHEVPITMLEENNVEEDAEEAVNNAPSKSKKGKAKENTEPDEKRLARFKKQCPKSIQERVERVKSQRFYMIGRERLDGALQETFDVLGSTGNVYTVTISHIPKCTCPDASKGNHCKHIIFVFLKILSVPDTSSYYYQKALLTSELEEIFTSAPLDPSLVASQRVGLAFAKATGAAVESSEEGGTHPGNRRNVDGEACPVCYEEMEGKTEDELANIFFCDICLNGLHADCFKMWATKPPVTCVYCRAPVIVNDVGPGGVVMSGKYINLAREAGVSRQRDTSTYYQGVVKGKKHWQRYDYGDD